MSRVRCSIAGCGRSVGERQFRERHGSGDEWICPIHWAAIPKQRRRAYNRLKRKERATGLLLFSTRLNRAWRALKQQAERIDNA